MTALSEVRAAIATAPPARKDWDRVLFIGYSARHAICAEDDSILDGDKSTIDGVTVMPTMEFDGWVLREIGPEGRWFEVGE